MFMYARPKLLRPNFLIPAVLLASAWQAHAVSWTLTQAGPFTWTYTLTFDPLDNYSIFQGSTTITMNGLTGVTSAGAPTLTDFTGSLDTLNLAWTPQVLNGGTTVVWTHVGGGTGNFGTAKHVFGFSITAPTASNGSVSFVTSGMSRDVGNPLPGGGFNVDISGSVQGPRAALPATPAPSTLTLALVSIGFFVVAYQIKRRVFQI
jgi:hypothetical protein